MTLCYNENSRTFVQRGCMSDKLKKIKRNMQPAGFSAYCPVGFTGIVICMGMTMNYCVSDTMPMAEKLGILADAAKYDVACTSSGV